MAHQIDDLNMLQRAQLLWSLMRDDRVSPWLKRVGPVAIVVYVLSPIDVIPDVLLGPGQVDDLGIIAVGLVLMLRLITRFAPDAVVMEHVSRIGNVERQAESTTATDSDETIETSGRVRRPGSTGNG